MAVVLPVSYTHLDVYKRQAEALREAGMAVETDFRNEKINYKVREHSVTKVPVIIVCGRKEAEERTVNIRRLGSQNQTPMSLEDAITSLVEEATPPDVKRKLAAKKQVA